MKDINLSHKKEKKYKGSNLGLHCHCAEDKEHFIELLRRAKAENVGLLIINNYKSLKSYSQVLPTISESELSEFRRIKMLPSVEMPGAFNFTNLDGQNYNIETHILGYGVDLDKERLLDEFSKQKYKSLNQEEELQRLISIGHRIGLNFKDEDCYLDPNDDNRKFAGRAFTQGLMKNMDDNFCSEGEDNKNKLPYELRTNWRAFQNRCVKDLNNPFYLDVATLNPSVDEVIDLIHRMGGKAYLAHPSSYFSKIGNKEDIEKAFQNTVKFAQDFMKKYSPNANPRCHIDGVEVYHPSYLGNMEVTSEIKELIQEHRLGSSGGTDIHVDKTLGENETVSSDSIGGRVKKNKLKKFRFMRRKAKNILAIRSQVKKLKEAEEERI